ncbi:MAG TPA: PASTA domain-containing protein, partial [Acidimicrobiia bacterium]|nr:PASTA domain-containing protein [Acidimicrobiia bacterium]
PRADDSYLPPPKPDYKKRRAGAVVAVVLLVMLAGVIVALIVSQLTGSSSNTANVPDVTSSATQFADAKKQIVALGFKVERRDEANESIPEGQVIAQSPNPSATLHKGKVVTLRVSSGLGNTTVPNIVGLTASDAAIALQNKGLSAKAPLIPEESDKPQGTVLRTDPAAGKQIKKGGQVNVVLAVTRQVTVREVTNTDAVQAANQLGNDGFVTKPMSESSDTVTTGDVTRTDPKAGDKAPKGSTITIYVSSGPDSTIPNVQGETEAQAKADLAKAGFTNVTSQYLSTTSANDGNVIGQIPGDGNKYPKSQAITLQVGRAASTSTATSTSTPTSST